MKYPEIKENTFHIQNDMIQSQIFIISSFRAELLHKGKIEYNRGVGEQERDQEHIHHSSQIALILLSLSLIAKFTWKKSYICRTLDFSFQPPTPFFLPPIPVS
jgi:hypothetical protein